MPKNMHLLPALTSSDDELPHSSHHDTTRPSALPATTSKKTKAPLPSTSQRPIMQSSTTSKKRKQILPVTPHKQHSSYELFGTDSEEEEVEVINEKPRKAVKTPPPPPPPSREEYEHIKKSKRSTDPRPSTSTITSRKRSARDVFGSDSDDDDEHLIEKSSGKKAPPIFSYFSKRIASGVARQSDTGKQGSHYIELKVYDCDEIKNITPMNRWRHAIITIKNRTNDDTEAWTHLTEFIRATRKEFKNCRPDIINGC